MRLLGFLLVAALLVVGCRVELDDVVEQTRANTPAAGTSTDPETTSGGDQVGGDETGADDASAGDEVAASGEPNQSGVLPALGPLPAASHWHAAYVVRICDDVLLPIESESDPLGIHTHGDGLIHIHPFFEEAGYEQATLGLFADAVGLGLVEGELTLPTGGTWRDGDVCDGVPSQVYVDRWQGPFANSPVERIFTDLEDIRFTGDGELYQIAFAPPDAPPVVPPAESLLPEVSNFGPVPEPWIEVPSSASIEQAYLWAVASITAGPCENGAIAERVSTSDARCFEREGEPVAAVDGVVSARAVEFNRRPAVEIIMDAPLQQLVQDHFGTSEDPFVFAVELDGGVSAVAQLFRPPLANRLVLASGFSEGAARAMAELLNS